MAASMLEISAVRKSYRVGPAEVKVLKGIDLTVERGELLAIIGPSGSGKSTLMHILGLLERPDEGSYSIDGTRVVYDDDRALSTLRNLKIGFVFQQYHLLPKLTALENVGIPLIYRGMKAGEVRKRGLDFLAKVDMSGRIEHRPNEMSGGQQQRVAIARALAGTPAIVLADEPTGALDTKTGEEIMALFQRLNREEGITIVIITHNPALGAQRSDIQNQFLIESVLLCLAGGMVGIGLGIGASYLFAHFSKWAFSVSCGAIILGVGVATVVGVFCGLYPARTAARIDPIKALRS